MKKTIGTIWTAAIITVLVTATGTPAAFAQDDAQDAVEEIVVTGSFIKRQSFDDVGSPVDVLDREDILANAPTGKMSEVLQYLPQNLGVLDGVVLDGSTDLEGTFGGASLDLRGLGGGATLVLMNGRRQTRFPLADDGRTEITNLMPGIALERVEVLNDGASAIYGTDAVAGVVNFLSRKNFEGVELSIDGRGTTNSFNHSNFTLGALFGAALGSDNDIHVTAAVEYYSQEPLQRGEPDFTYPEGDIRGSSSGFPGTWRVPTRDALGNLTGATADLADPDCQAVADQNITFNDSDLGGTDTFLGGGRCRLSFRTIPYFQDEERLMGMASVNWDINERVSFEGSFNYARSRSEDAAQGSAPIVAPLFVSGDNPGNPYRAVNADGNPLFAQDTNGDGIPDRDATTNTVILAANPLDPASGIAFNEDVTARFFRPLSTTNFGAAADNFNTINTIRVDAALLGEINDNWSWSTGWTFSEQSLTLSQADSIPTALQDAVDGLGGDAGESYFNPFGNSLLGGVANTDDVISGFRLALRDRAETSLWSVDAVITGDLVEMPAGPLGVAFGVQYRDEELIQDFDQFKTARLSNFFGEGEEDYSVSGQSTGVFVEFAIPVFNSDAGRLDLSLAGRYEEIDDLDSFDPKLSLLFRNELIAVRASAASSFLSPSLFQRFGTRVFRSEVFDPVLGEDAQIKIRTTGGAGLEPQESDSWNVGITVTPTDALSLGVDVWAFDFDGLLATPSPQGVIDADPNGPDVFRSSVDNRITLVNTAFFNSGRVEAGGIDFDVAYDTPWSLFGGDLGVKVQASLWTTYDIQETPGGAVIDGIGEDNRSNIGVALPELRGNAQLAWSNGPHSANAIVRHRSDVDRTVGANTDTADAETTLDLQYTREFGDSRWLTTFGVLNAFDNEPNILTTGFSPYILRSVQNPRGRMIYASIKWTLE